MRYYYETAKYLAKLLPPLGQSKHTVIDTADFIKRIKIEKIPKRYKMISFDVKSLFTDVSLNELIAIILRKLMKNIILFIIMQAFGQKLLWPCSRNSFFI